MYIKGEIKIMQNNERTKWKENKRPLIILGLISLFLMGGLFTTQNFDVPYDDLGMVVEIDMMRDIGLPATTVDSLDESSGLYIKSFDGSYLSM